MSQQAEIMATRWRGAGYERVKSGTLGHSTHPHTLLVHVVTWWHPGTVWRTPAARWLCGNGSHLAVRVTEVPARMAMCRACERRTSQLPG